MGIWAFLTALFQSFTQGGKVAEKSIPSPEVQKDMYETKKPRLKADEMKRILREAKHHLRFNRKEDIDTYVEFAYDHLELDDKIELKKLLHESLPNHQ